MQRSTLIPYAFVWENAKIVDYSATIEVYAMRNPVYDICEQQRRSLISTFVVRFLDTISLLAIYPTFQDSSLHL